LRAVTVSGRTYIPGHEIERIINGEPAETKPASDNKNISSGEGAGINGNGLETENAKTPKERLAEILDGYGEFLARESSQLQCNGHATSHITH